MRYTLGQASKATGKTKSTIQRAIVKGRISAIKNDNGSYCIDPSELHRVYPVVIHNKPLQNTLRSTNSAMGYAVEQSIKLKEIEGELKASQKRCSELLEQKEDLKKERDDWKDQAKKLLLTATKNNHSDTKKSFIKRLWG